MTWWTSSLALARASYRMKRKNEKKKPNLKLKLLRIILSLAENNVRLMAEEREANRLRQYYGRIIMIADDVLDLANAFCCGGKRTHRNGKVINSTQVSLLEIMAFAPKAQIKGQKQAKYPTTRRLKQLIQEYYGSEDAYTYLRGCGFLLIDTPYQEWSVAKLFSNQKKLEDTLEYLHYYFKTLIVCHYWDIVDLMWPKLKNEQEQLWFEEILSTYNFFPESYTELDSPNQPIPKELYESKLDSQYNIPTNNSTAATQSHTAQNCPSYDYMEEEKDIFRNDYDSLQDNSISDEDSTEFNEDTVPSDKLQIQDTDAMDFHEQHSVDQPLNEMEFGIQVDMLFEQQYNWIQNLDFNNTCIPNFYAPN